MPTIASTLRSTARRIPAATALVFGETRYSYAELDAAVDRTATALAVLGLAKGDRIALMAANSAQLVITCYAAFRIGAILVPVNPAASAPELTYLVQDSDAAILVIDATLADTVDAVGEQGLPDTVRHVLSLGASTGFADLTALAADAPATETPSTVEEADDALIIYTSGTTGRPKGALFDHHRSLWVANACVAVFGIRVDDRVLHAMPLYHAAGLCLYLIPGIMVGTANIVLAGFDPATVADTLESERITVFGAVPTMFRFLLRVPDLAGRDFSGWRSSGFGAAPMPASTVQDLVAAFPHVSFVQVCGQSEAGPSGIYATFDQVKARPTASGRQAMPFTEARVVDPGGNDVEPGGVGELILRGETIMKGYWNKPAETAEVLRDGWLHTGDLAKLDADGYVTLIDRLKDVIITGGRNVYSVEVENALAAHPDILDVAVIARPDPDYGESVVAVLTVREDATVTLDEVRQFCRGRISGYKIPRAIVLGDIPRNASGKVLKHRLRETYAHAPESAAGQAYSF